MLYPLIFVFLIAAGWGLAALFSMPMPGLSVLVAGTAVVLLGSVFWVVVLVHGLDVVIALREHNRQFLSRFAGSLRPDMLSILITGLATALILAFFHWVVPIPVAHVVLSGAPLYIFSILGVLLTREPTNALGVRWRARLTISLAYGALMLLALYLLAQVTTMQLSTWAKAWLAATSLASATACYLSAADFKASILHRQVQPSLTIQRLLPKESASPGVPAIGKQYRPHSNRQPLPSRLGRTPAKRGGAGKGKKPRR